MPTTEAFSRAIIDALLKDQGWNLTDGRSVRFEYTISDDTRADYLLCDRHGKGMAIIEAKRTSINAADAAYQARRYAECAQVPFVFLANGQETRFWDWQHEAHPHFDIVAVAPRGHFVVIECTLGLLRADSKLSKLTARATSLRDASQGKIWNR